MKAFSRYGVVVLSLLLVAGVSAQEDQAAGEPLVPALERTAAKFLSSVEGLTEEQWHFKPAPDRWSIAECAEHIAVSESFIRGVVEKMLDKPAEPVDAEARKDAVLMAMLVDRTSKFNAPDPLVPQERFESDEETVATFTRERGETIKLAKNASGLRDHAGTHPALGNVDAYGWLLIIAGHSERHTLQIEEIKQSEGYPAN
ncbi:MAG TPA: DinB family protein [Thermoanaerobaculia bacterium]